MDTRLVFLAVLALCCWTCGQAVDVTIGEEKRLECRFDPALMSRNPTFYWIRSNVKDKDNVAIGDSPLDKHYRIVFKPSEGQYDLIVTGSLYERDNGKFECRIKEQGTGMDLHEQATELTVLIPPGTPQINPVSPVAIEGQETELVCSSVGGNPDPVLRWYRKGESKPLEALTKAGGSRSVATTSTLMLQPGKDDDGAEYRCVAWNRAIDQEDKKEATVKISVNYTPRVTVGPANPVQVEQGSAAQITCSVDAKPSVNNVRWMRNGRFLATSFNHTLRSVSRDDDGVYLCTADNGLGKTGEAELRLEVLHAPVVNVEFRREVEAGSSASISCNVTSNPPAVSVQWLKEGDESFSATGEVLRLSRVTAEHAGRYYCVATNIINGVERTGNGSTQFLVRHAPGTTNISPEDTFAVEDKSITLTCGANPPGWPLPQYRWWRAGAEATPLSIGPEFTIPVVRQNNEGIYFCQPSNEIGVGTPASIGLKVYQAPRLMAQLPQVLQKRAGDVDFNVTCSAQGKPKPSITWMKNDQVLTNSPHYDIKIEESEGRNNIFTVRSTLRFQGPERPHLSQLTPDDRGAYKCVFENEVRPVESTMMLKIEHAPILLGHKAKAASSVGQEALLSCRMQAYPRPSFDWFFKDTPILNDGLNYDMNVTSLANDVYVGVLSIKETSESDYGNYVCRAANAEGEHNGMIHLQPTSEPEKPTNLRLVQAGYDFLTLEWDEGFNGGYENTIFNVVFTSNVDGSLREYDCQTSNPCVVRGLEQLQSYAFQVKAVNSKGQSALSNALTASTILDLSRIPEPERVTFDPKAKIISFYADSILNLIGFVEARDENSDWYLAQKITVRSSANREVLDLVNDDTEEIRLKICLEINTTICSPSVIALPGDIIPLEATKAEFPSKYMIAIVVACIVGSLLLVLVFVFYCYRRRRSQKLEKILAMEKAHNSSRPVPAERPPPPYYAGMENKPKDQSIDTTDNPTKALYATQNGYGYHPASHAPGGSDWVNMAYTENSYSNSNNGGSVNSQDSLWQVKANNGEVAHDMSYNYDPMTHGGYGGFEDYGHYPQPNDTYLNQRNHEYGPANGDPYAAIHKAPKRLDHLESQYHNVSGLPDPYMEGEAAEENKPQPISLSFDESLESGYSTPNSRNRRVIHEIIV